MDDNSQDNSQLDTSTYYDPSGPANMAARGVAHEGFFKTMLQDILSSHTGTIGPSQARVLMNQGLRINPQGMTMQQLQLLLQQPERTAQTRLEEAEADPELLKAKKTKEIAEASKVQTQKTLYDQLISQSGDKSKEAWAAKYMDAIKLANSPEANLSDEDKNAVLSMAQLFKQKAMSNDSDSSIPTSSNNPQSKTYVNPKTGQTITQDSTGRWVDVKTGQVVK